MSEEIGGGGDGSVAACNGSDLCAPDIMKISGTYRYLLFRSVDRNMSRLAKC